MVKLFLTSLNITEVSDVDGATSTKIRLIVTPESNDIIAVRNQVLEIDLNNTTINASVDTIATGSASAGVGVATQVHIVVHLLLHQLHQPVQQVQRVQVRQVVLVDTSYVNNDNVLNNKVSNHIQHQLPEFIQADHPVFSQFVKLLLSVSRKCRDYF